MTKTSWQFLVLSILSFASESTAPIGTKAIESWTSSFMPGAARKSSRVNVSAPNCALFRAASILLSARNLYRRLSCYDASHDISVIQHGDPCDDPAQHVMQFDDWHVFVGSPFSNNVGHHPAADDHLVSHREIRAEFVCAGVISFAPFCLEQILEQFPELVCRLLGEHPDKSRQGCDAEGADLIGLHTGR